MLSLIRDEAADKKRDTAANYSKQIQSSVESISTMDAVMSFARQMSLSTAVPIEYRGNPANCLAAVSLAIKMREEPYTIAMNLRISDRPSWYAPYMIARLHQSQIFKTRLAYRTEGEGVKLTCVAYARDENNQLVEGPVVSMAQVVAQGWANDPTSLWTTNPRQAIMYRAAVYFIRLHAPEVLHGVMSVAGCDDVKSPDPSSSTVVESKAPAPGSTAINADADPEQSPAAVTISDVVSIQKTEERPGPDRDGQKRRRGRPSNAEIAARKELEKRREQETPPLSNQALSSGKNEKGSEVINEETGGCAESAPLDFAEDESDSVVNEMVAAATLIIDSPTC